MTGITRYMLFLYKSNKKNSTVHNYLKKIIYFFGNFNPIYFDFIRPKMRNEGVIIIIIFKQPII